MSTFNEDVFFLWDVISRSSLSNKSQVQIRVFRGAKNSCQYGPFMAAIRDVLPSIEASVHPRVVVVEYADVESVCSKKWSMENLIDWLLESHIHMIITHIHQGFRSHQVELDMQNVESQLKRLKFHNGFPNGDQLKCPVFTQNKIKYLHLLSNKVNETFVIDLPHTYSSIHPSILDDLLR